MTRRRSCGPGGQRRDQRGTALIEFTWLALLLMLPVIYLVIAVFDAQRTAYGASDAARAAARAYSLAGSTGAGEARGRTAAALALRDQGVQDPPEVSFSCVGGDCFAPGASVRVVVETRADLPLVPTFGGTPPSVRVTAVQQVPFGAFVESGS